MYEPVYIQNQCINNKINLLRRRTVHRKVLTKVIKKASTRKKKNKLYQYIYRKHFDVFR